MSRLTAYGHSWVQGAGASAPHRRLVDLTACSLGLLPDSRGVGGTLSTQTAELVRRVAPPPSAAYLVMTGLNDIRLRGDSRRALHEYGSALDAVLGAVALASPAAVVAVVEQPHLLDYSGHAPHDRGTDGLVDRGNDALREVVARHAGAVAVHAEGWDRHTMLDEDTVHPNDAGHAAVAQAVAAALKALLREPAGSRPV
ncbi:SGNH/GDSL hydrolase family protein [Pseudonocardia nigra]|uniref:SGNH/GDSL hydrolase family protein n=1 Tax=Pseudonocardia nigra TaxID=1921578 RepID=UPI001C602E46|nr:SGNH/GDSL hydrolase family protein [Pseudonocardia nigra]